MTLVGTPRQRFLILAKQFGLGVDLNQTQQTLVYIHLLSQICPSQVRVPVVAALPNPRDRHDDSLWTHFPGALPRHQVGALQQETQQRY